MISHVPRVPGPLGRLAGRLYRRWVSWLDGLCPDVPAPPQLSQGGGQALALRGLPAVLRRLQDVDLREPVRAVARRTGVSKSTAHRARQRILQFENIP